MTAAFSSAAFAYRNGTLCAEAVPLAEIAADVGTPCYVYAQAQIQASYAAVLRGIDSIPVRLRFAVRACGNVAVMGVLARMGLGADVTTAGELKRALAAGVAADKIVFSGLGKRRDEIAAALLAGTGPFHIESVPELMAVNAVAVETGRKANVLLRINLDAAFGQLTSSKDGAADAKFGMGLESLGEAVALAAGLPGVTLKGLAAHVKAGGNDAARGASFGRMADMVRLFRAQGFAMDCLGWSGDVGPSCQTAQQAMAAFAADMVLMRDVIVPLGCELSWDLGGFLTAEAGVLLTEVVGIKPSALGDVVLLDAGIQDFLAPTLCGARAELLPVRACAPDEAMANYIVAGLLLDRADLFGTNYAMPASVGPGDLVAVLHAGAYGCATASAYGGHPLVPEVMVAGAESAVVRRRVSVAEQMGWESAPLWKDGHG